MMSRMLAAAVAMAAPAAVAASGLPAPLDKVVALLQDMKVQLNKDMADDKVIHEKLGCWCKTNRKEKGEAVQIATAKLAQLNQFVAEATAKLQELKTKKTGAQAEVVKNTDALAKAAAMRAKETESSVKEQKELNEASKAVTQALEILSKGKPSLVQMKWAASRLQAAQVVALVQGQDASTLKEFVGQLRTTESFLAPGYESQSGEVVGFLKGLKENFSADLKKSQDREKAAAAAFVQLKAAKEGEIAAGKKMALDLEQDIASFGEKQAAAAQQLKDSSKQLEADQAFLQNLEKRCSEGSGEYDQRMKDRQNEISAVEDTVAILNSDEVFNAFSKQSKKTSFMQIAKAEQDTRQQALAALQKVAHGDAMPRMMLLALALEADPVSTVVSEITKLQGDLNKQQKDEADKKAWCLDSISKNQKSTESETKSDVSLVAQSSQLDNTMKGHIGSIDRSNSSIAEMRKQLKVASQNREKENKEFQQTVADQRLTREVLSKALNRMKSVYGFMQQDHAAAPAAGAEPEGFKKYQKSGKAGKALELIQTIIKDSEKAEKDATEAEGKAQKAYEEFVKNSNKSIDAYKQKILTYRESHAKASQDFVLAQTNHNQTVARIEGLGTELKDLHSTCDSLVKNFVATQAARADEIKALDNVKTILSQVKK